MNRIVFLDRDGVLNEPILRDGKPHPPGSVTELAISPDAPEALADLKSAGFKLAVITNQPDVARGAQDRETVEAINNALTQQLPIDHVAVCWHDDADDCDCRKPKPGLIHQAAKALDANPTGGYLIGDRWRDIAAAQAVGCLAVWIDRGYNEPAHQTFDHRTTNLLEATQWILQHPPSP